MISFIKSKPSNREGGGVELSIYPGGATCPLDPRGLISKPPTYREQKKYMHGLIFLQLNLNWFFNFVFVKICGYEIALLCRNALAFILTHFPPTDQQSVETYIFHLRIRNQLKRTFSTYGSAISWNVHFEIFSSKLWFLYLSKNFWW